MKDASDNLQGATALVTSVKDIGVLAVVALVVIFGILWTVLVARKRPADQEPLNNQITQQGALIKQLESDREERKDLLNRLFDRDKEREDRTIESIAALTAIQESSRATLAKVETIVVSFDSRDKNSTTMFQTLNENMDKMVNQGSEPVQTIGKRVEEILKIVTDILSAANEIQSKITSLDQLNTSLTEIQLAISALKGVDETLTQKKGDSQPVSVVVVSPQVAQP